MLKRYQVLLPDWMEDNIKYYIDKYGLSFSEGEQKNEERRDKADTV